MKENTLQKIYEATNKGLDIILHYYPQAAGCERKGKYFKMREDEKTASACMKEINGVMRVTDFGDEQKALTPVEICMKEERLDFREAVKKLAAMYGVDGEKRTENRPTYSSRPAKPEEKEGQTDYELNEKMTDKELKILGPRVTQEVCDRYNYYSVKWKSTVKNRKVHIFSSNEDYPIFMHDCGKFKKFYEPLAADKGRRFSTTGEKEPGYINGLQELKKLHEKHVKDMDGEAETAEAEGEEKTRKKKSGKLPEAILCSGERDALNCAGLGYPPLWLNSESAELDAKSYAEIMKHVEVLYNVPDTDSTGIRMGRKLAMKYIDIRTIELPESLAEERDWRGKPKKDLRDWVEKDPSIKNFKEMVKVAKPCRFWEKTYTKEKARYEINTLYLLHFLKVNGFGKIVDNENDTVTYVQQEGYKVKQISTRKVQDFIQEWAKKERLDVEIQNLILNSARVNGTVFEKMEPVTPDFTNFDERSQTLFFENTAVKVTAESVEQTKGETGKSVWERGICKHKFKRREPAFSWKWNEEKENYDIEIKDMSSNYFRFLTNASRIYWKEEFEERAEKSYDKNMQYMREHHWDIDGPRLTEEEREEQRQHLANKMFCVGYMMHSYKSLSKAWAVWIMENRISEEDESGGGSGKTFMTKFLKQFKNTEKVNGRDKKLTENQFFMDRVTEATDILIIDDAAKYMNFDYFYSMITDNMVVNYKNAKSKEIDFRVSPKLVISSNFPPPASDGSTARRILTCVFSDYYHQATDSGEYRETVRISDDFGRELHDGSYTEEEWNQDINFCIDCLQFYLSTIPRNIMIQPPMENVDKRMRMQEMGTEFMEWAEVFFSKGSENLDKYLDKKAIKEAFDPKRRYSTNGFTRRLKMFCKDCDYIETMNPPTCPGYTEKGKRILRKTEGETKEYIYMKTKGTPVKDTEEDF